MAGPPPPPPPAQWPLSLVTPACYNRILGMGADNWASQYSRPNSELGIPGLMVALELDLIVMIVTIINVSYQCHYLHIR
ncbi:hypothetical protein A2U01_0018099 [Trifolium medium]|uniref:Uncharacterized protein n=1 Tax=Trifolium medium TaxID=97028 RepID=A0A392NB80_9FABA|nr:hypothetical protein [Trifolium medium]